MKVALLLLKCLFGRDIRRDIYIIYLYIYECELNLWPDGSVG